MKPRKVLLALALSVAHASTLAGIDEPAAVVNAPVLKWQRGGCGSFCQTGWYSSPAVADLDGDGQPEVIWGSYDLVAVNGANGALKWRSSNGNRVWPGVVVADLTGNGTLEVVVGRNGNSVVAHNSNGSVLWTRTAFPGQSGEVRTLAVEDLETDGQLEVVVGRGSGGEDRQLNVFGPDGTGRAGWPARHTGELGFGWGMYNENVAVADMNGDGFKEIFGPTDTHYITALDRNGNQLLTSSIYNGFNPVGPKPWARVGVHVDQAADLTGFADCGTQHRPNFANSAPAIADVDGDGTLELVVVGDVYNCDIGDPDGDLYHAPFIFKLDRTRWSGSGFDWTVIPTPPAGSGPRSQDFDVIQNSVQNVVVADLDGDGKREILYPSYDGRLHAFWLDKTEHGNWPHQVPASGAPGDEFRFASEPAVVDLDGDGHAEVLFTSWPKNGGNRIGHLHILDYLGNELQRISLPASPDDDWNGGLGAPTVANIDADADADLEVVVGTISSGLVAYDLPGSSNARVLWGTGRGSYKRTGVAPAATTVTRTLSIDDRSVAEGSAVNAAFRVVLSGASTSTVTLQYQTANNTAVSGSDYTTTSGTLTFTPGRTQQSIFVPIVTDTTAEGSESFFVNLTSPVNATLLDAQAVGTITDPPAAAKIAMYRSYSKAQDYHFFTTDLSSKNFAVGTLGFQDESTPTPFYVWNVMQAGTVPLFRLYNPNLGRHFYTSSVGSRDFIMSIGGLYEKEEGFVFPLSTTPVPAGATELYLLYNNNSGTHLFTADPNQKTAILNLFLGIWVQHTSVGYVFTSP